MFRNRWSDHVGDYPWEEQSIDTRSSYAAFRVYRDLGPRRSLRKAADAYYNGATTGEQRQFEHWSSTKHWVGRACDFDDWVESERMAIQFEARQTMETLHIQIAKKLQLIALEQIDQIRPGELAPAVALRMFVAGVKIERQARQLALDQSTRLIQELAQVAPVTAPKKRHEPTDKERMAAILEALSKAGVNPDQNDQLELPMPFPDPIDTKLAETG